MGTRQLVPYLYLRQRILLKGENKMRKINDAIATLYKEGAKEQDIKYVITKTLEPYFTDSQILNECWQDMEIIGVFEVIMLYHNDEVFEKELGNILNLYRTSLDEYKDETLKILIDDISGAISKQNNSFYIKEDIPDFQDDDFRKIVFKCMQYIGQLLESAAKFYTFELWAFITLTRKGKVDYNKIKDMPFGQVVNNILDTDCYTGIFLTIPEQINISDWRNASCHQSYEVIDKEKIRITFGKKEKERTIEITLNQLKKYVYQIQRSTQIMGIARMIFYYDNLNLIKEYMERNHIEVYNNFSLEWKKLFIESRLLCKGHSLRNLSEAEDKVTAVIESQIEDNKSKEIALLLINLWTMFKKEETQIDFYINGHKKYEYKVDQFTCEHAFKGLCSYEEFISKVGVSINK